MLIRKDHNFSLQISSQRKMSFWHREEFSKFSSTLLWAGWTQISSSRWDSDNCELSGHMLTELEEPNKYEHPSDKWALRNMDARADICQHGKISPTKNAGHVTLFFFLWNTNDRVSDLAKKFSPTWCPMQSPSKIVWWLEEKNFFSIYPPKCLSYATLLKNYTKIFSAL